MYQSSYNLISKGNFELCIAITFRGRLKKIYIFFCAACNMTCYWTHIQFSGIPMSWIRLLQLRSLHYTLYICFLWYSHFNVHCVNTIWQICTKLMAVSCGSPCGCRVFVCYQCRIIPMEGISELIGNVCKHDDLDSTEWRNHETYVILAQSQELVFVFFLKCV